MPRVTVDGVSYNLNPTGPRNWGREGNDFATGVANELDSISTEVAVLAEDIAEFDAGLGYINVLDYGAVGDGETLCGDAFRAAVAAAEASEFSKTVYVPPGEYVVDKPVVPGSYVRILGSGYGTKFVTNNTFNGQVFLLGPDEGDFPRAAGGPFGSGYYYPIPRNGTGNGSEVINLRDSPQLDINGNAQFNASCWFWPNAGVSSGAIMGCAGTYGPNAQTITFQMFCNSTTDIRLILNVGGTRREIGTFGGELIEDAWNYLEASYNGTTVRMFVNGVMVGSVAATGTITQSPEETWFVGLAPGKWPEANNVSAAKTGRITGIQIRHTAVRTTDASYTVPTSLPGNDFGTLCWCNFDEVDGMFLIHRGAGNQPTYTPIRRDLGTGFVIGASVENVRFALSEGAGCVLGRQAINGTYRDITVEGGRYGVLLGNNCFNSTISNINSTLSSDGWCSIGIVNASGEVAIHGNCQLLGGDHGLIVESSSVFASEVYVLGQKYYPISVFGGSNTSINFNRATVSDEGISAAMGAAMLMYDVAGAVFNSCSFEQAQFDVSLIRFEDCRDIIFNAPLLYSRGGGSTALFHDLDDTDSISRIRCNSPRVVNGTGHERCNEIGVVTYDTDYKSGQVTISDLATSAAVAFDVDFPTGDTGYRIALSLGGVTGTPDPGAYTAYWSAKANTGFTINLTEAPDTGNSVIVHWTVSR